MKSILYITNAINGVGGLERVLSIKANYLADKLGYKVTILCLNDGHVAPFYNFSGKIGMISVPLNMALVTYIFPYAVRIRSAVEIVDPDIVSVCDDGLKGFSLPFVLRRNRAIIYERHASVVLNFEQSSKFNCVSRVTRKLRYQYMRWAAGKFDRFIVLTNGNLQEWNMGNVEVIANPLPFFPESTSIGDSLCVIAVGSHSHNKGYDLLLKAWRIVVKDYPNWSLSIYGRTDEGLNFAALAKSLDISNSVVFYDPVNNIESKYVEASVLVLPSRSEGFGMVLLEAMACGLPCVSFNCPHGPADIIHDKVDGFLVTNGDISEFASTLSQLLESKGLRQLIGAKARLQARNYRVESILAKWDLLFSSLITLQKDEDRGV